MDLSTTYLGLELKNPLVASASPLSRDVASVRSLEDSGIAAVVMYSLFQEQIEHDAAEQDHYEDFGGGSFAEATSYFPAQAEFPRGPDAYLEHLSAIKEAVGIPVIASLNGSSPGGWMEYAKGMEQAGADALELNTYFLATDPETTSEAIEQRYFEALASVRASVRIPVAMKINPYISALAHFAKRLDEGGVDGLVLFNRFYQPDIDLDQLDIDPTLTFSAMYEMRLPLRWIAILDPQLKCSLAASTGVYNYTDVLKLVMAGASVTMLCAALLQYGPPVIGRILEGLTTWMAEREYESVRQMQGSMNLASCRNPAAFERGNYMRALNSFTPNA